MAIFPYSPCDPQRDPLSCFIYPDILNRVDQILPPMVSEAAQNTVPPPRTYDMQFVINPVAGGGRVGGLVQKFERRASIEPWLRVLGRPIHTSPYVDAMTEKFASARRGLSWGNPVFLPILSGDSGLSKAMDALSRLPDIQGSHVVVVPVDGVGTARDIPRLAGAPSFTARLPHALMRSVSVPYYGVDASGNVGAGRHFHSIASGVGGKLFQVVHSMLEDHPTLLRLKKISSVFGVMPYLMAFVPIYKMVRSGDLIVEVEVTQGDRILFRGKTCGIITAIVPGVGSVTRIPGVDPTHGQAVLLIIPEDAKAALITVIEGMWLRVKSLIPGTKVPDMISTLAAERQIALGQNPVQLKFSSPSPMEANGDYVGDVSTIVLQVAEKPATMMVNRNSLFAKLAGYQKSDLPFESVLRLGEVGMLGAGLVGALYPGMNAEKYRDMTHKLMLGMVHGTTFAIMAQHGSPFAFHLRLLSMLPAFMAMQKGAEFLPITDKKWQIFAQNYLPLAVMGVMQYFRITPTVGNAVRLVAPGTYSSIMGSRLMVGASRHLLGRLATTLYSGGYIGALAVWLYQSGGDQRKRDQTAVSWIESTLTADNATMLASWVHDTYTRTGAEPEITASVEALCTMNGEEVETFLRSSTTPEVWGELDQLATRMQKLDLAKVQRDARAMTDAPNISKMIVSEFFRRTVHEDVSIAFWHKALFRALVHHDYDIITAADKPGVFGLAAVMAFHRRHDASSPYPAPRVIPELLAFLTSDNN